MHTSERYPAVFKTYTISTSAFVSDSALSNPRGYFFVSQERSLPRTIDENA